MTLDDLKALPPTISVEEAARLLSVSRGHAYQLARIGELPGVLRLGHRYVVSTARLLAVLGVNGEAGSQDPVPRRA